MTDNIALLDMDSTIADFDSAMAEHLIRLASPGEPPLPVYGTPVPVHIKERKSIIKRQPGFWRGLLKLQLGFDVVEVLLSLKFEIHVLTKGPNSTVEAWTEKIQWAQDHLPDTPVTITQDKSLVYGRVLVDDWPPYFEAWLKVRPRGLVICIAHPWNKNVNDPRVIRYDGTNIDQVREALLKARDRKPGQSIDETDPTVSLDELLKDKPRRIEINPADYAPFRKFGREVLTLEEDPRLIKKGLMGFFIDSHTQLWTNPNVPRGQVAIGHLAPLSQDINTDTDYGEQLIAVLKNATNPVSNAFGWSDNSVLGWSDDVKSPLAASTADARFPPRIKVAVIRDPNPILGFTRILYGNKPYRVVDKLVVALKDVIFQVVGQAQSPALPEVFWIKVLDQDLGFTLKEIRQEWNRLKDRGDFAYIFEES